MPQPQMQNWEGSQWSPASLSFARVFALSASLAVNGGDKVLANENKDFAAVPVVGDPGTDGLSQ